MKQTRTVYNRLVGAFIFTTFIISGLYGVLVFNAMEYTEDDILTLRVEMEAQHFIRQYQRNKQEAKLPSSIGLYSYLSTSPDLPQWLKEQPLGTRELHDREVHVGVSVLPDNAGLLYIVLSELESSSLENNLSTLFVTLLSVGVVMTLVGLVIGVLLGRYITEPLIRLTTEIDRFEDSAKAPGDTSRFLPFHGYGRDDEVGALSRSFTHLVERLEEFLEREKQFTSYASHELRTPLTIMRNALALLRLQESEAERKARNLDRIENAVLEMEGLIEIFLHLGREDRALVTDLLDAGKILKSSLDKHAYINEVRVIDISTQIDSRVVIHNHPRLVQILFDNAVRNMFLHASSQATVKLDKNGLTIENDAAVPPNGNERRSEAYGLDIIERISEYCHFSFAIKNDGERFSISISFNAVERD